MARPQAAGDATVDTRERGGTLGFAALVLGVIVGAGLAGVAVQSPMRATKAAASARASEGDGAVAIVNGAPVTVARYQRALAAVTSERRAELDAQALARLRERVLERVIDEELLVQRGLELGLAREDPQVRADLVAAVIDAAIAPGPDAMDDAGVAEEAALREHLARHPERFRGPSRVTVEHLAFRGAGSLSRAREVRAALVGGASFDSQRPRADPAILELPAGPVSAVKLRDYLGATLATACAELEEGVISEPLRVGDAVHLLRVRARTVGATPALAQARERVAADLARARDDQRLRAYLEQLRGQARIDRMPP